jgi:CRISPR-associated endonuclease/helicase Cas3
MEALLSFWAKLGKETWPERYHPVLYHLIDVAAVTRSLWDCVFRPRFRQSLAGRLGFDDESACSRWIAFFAGAHDIGKIAACFQYRNNRETEALKKRLEGVFEFPCWDKPHGTISTAILADLLQHPAGWPPLSSQLAERIAISVGGHHGLFPPNWGDVQALLQASRKPCPWDDARRQILGALARLLGVGPPTPKLVDPADQSVFMALAGLTSVADWIGSNQTFFESKGNKETAAGKYDLDTYYRHAQGQAHKALKELGWLGREQPAQPVAFPDLFAGILSGPPRPLQTAVEEIVTGMTEPSLLIVEAPMGEGKTEAGWYAAACWDRCGGQGAYVALPTMATSNQMFDRVGQFLESGPGKKNIMLQHGKAALNDQFEKLKYAAENYDDEKKPSAVVAEGWFAANKKHGLLAPYGVGTIDQALLAVLQTKHVFVRLFGLAGKCVILDEVHAYDAYMTTLMERLLRWLAALGCPVVLLSATLPTEKRRALIDAYAPGAVLTGESASYPRLTIVRPGAFEERHVKADPHRARTVQLGWLKEDRVADELRQSLATGGCAVVIRNTVGLAQETYLELKKAFANEIEAGELQLDLFHARFPFGRRQQIEDASLKRYGRTKDDGMDRTRIVSAPHRPKKAILVATQVVEQSLDLDFDLMVSDVAPVDLVLQRAGRLHRHERGARPERVNEPRVWLIEPEMKEGLPDFGRSEYVYARFVLLRSLLALRAIEPSAIELPGHLESLVEQVYGDKPLTIPDGWQAALDEAEQELKEEQRTQRKKAKGVMIYSPDDEDLLRQQNAQLDEDNPEAAEKIRAATRDTEPTIQLIVVYQLNGQDFLDDAGREPFDETDEPNIERVRRLLNNEVTISHGDAGGSVPKGWREKGMLRHHRVVRVDGDGKSLPGDFFLRVDHELGVMFTED